ncbi:hypothetical protein ASPZODRAFT_68933 [Penicilliopsis zonata CBS 506.65]|uniref:Zn(2)-C6 fungal-type domain-containing protein n=1 Tax=Penicilliopsis zonata CBS 506.65 TaxID=1073090 RepID=A0A1L9SEX7_9EURO|nr:hypothetical protein ASPZODRAFT_68933 [Penicilliopsis zonata CBS 506.65]OJJ45729.1 hypothetical protein ASPZODRAFT_68933 [Penicilliopsis zonata CBS 506.65]
MCKNLAMADVPVKTSLPRKSAFSCEACRKRKVKCNGASPSCSRCAARGDTCVYSLAPTLSYTKQLESRVAQLEDALAKLRDKQSPGRKETSPASTSDSSASPKLQYKLKQEQEGGHELPRDFEGLQVGDDGRISFHGPTSLFQLPSGLGSGTSTSTHLVQELEARKERLINNAWRERALEQMATIPEPFQYLLDSHWCWIQPLFNFVYRPAFTRDMKINGPYYSDNLLDAILCHSVRWCKAEPNVGPLLEQYDNGALFHRRAVSRLCESLQSGFISIPTVQTLLLLSAQECGRGNRIQAWLYSGMAFRMLDDLGITIDSRKYSNSAQLTDEDIEIRNRLFWSCYFWDKLISLYFGRAPIMQHSSVSPPRMILDDTAEMESWVPHGVIFPDGTHYPPAQAHSTSCFMKMCGLAEILNQIMIHIYDPMRKSSEAEFLNCIQEQGQNLAEWWEELPDYLKLVATDLPPYCPPSHIVLLNCLYHTINILLHRPILCSHKLYQSRKNDWDKTHLVQCMASATTILSLYDLYCRTFGDSHVVLSLAYSVYTAASIFLLEIHALKFAATGTLDKLKFCIIALERVKPANPVISTALGLIYQDVQKLQIDLHIPIPIPHQDSHTPPPSHSSHSGNPGNGSRRVSPGLQRTANNTPLGTTSTPAMGTARDSHPGSILQGGFPLQQQPAMGFGLSQPNIPQMPPTHHLGGMPNAVMTMDGRGAYEITPEVFEAFSYAEPISTNMTPTFDTWHA